MQSESLRWQKEPLADSVHQKFVDRLARIYVTKRKKDAKDAAEWANRIVPFRLAGRVKEAMKRLGLK